LRSATTRPALRRQPADIPRKLTVGSREARAQRSASRYAGRGRIGARERDLAPARTRSAPRDAGAPPTDLSATRGSRCRPPMSTSSG
jgi:hypothetical protein